MKPTKRTELIRRFLLNAIRANNSHFLHDAIDTFQLSRQTIHKHLSSLVKEGYLTATGNTRARSYILGPKREHRAIFALKGLDESDIYYKNFGFIFKDLPQEIEKICHYGFTEILNNAIDHSGGVEVLVDVERTLQKISIRILDDGEGIFNHIARILNLADPRESLLELSKGKLTTDPVNHTGQGIFFTSRAFDRFWIFSGDLVFVHYDKMKDDYLTHTKEQEIGTNVLFDIALDSNRIIKSVFDAYTGSEDEDFVFNKTVIPLKLALFEGERLVSRSQAKRILNRVEKFTRVQLDFDGVDSIGQAFADEVFRVFARQHPQIALQAVNMTEEVRRMVIAAQKNTD